MKEHENVLVQKDKYKWRDNPPKVTREEMSAAFECAAVSENFECDCWNTACPYFGNCRACVVFHLCLKQFPTCQREMLGELEEYYIAKSQNR